MRLVSPACRWLAIVVSGLLLSACGGGGGTDAPGDVVASITVTASSTSLNVGQGMGATALARNAAGEVLTGRTVSWSSSNTTIATVTPDGMVQARSPGAVTITATAGTVSGSLAFTVAPLAGVDGQLVVTQMLAELPQHITRELAQNEALLPGNPHLASYIRSKSDMLRRPGLADEIVRNSQFAFTSFTSRDGRSIPVAVMFPLTEMRESALRTLDVIKAAAPVSETFLGTPFPGDRIRVWYGFRLGFDSLINLEDEETYVSRTPVTRNPHSAGAIHEMTHAFMGHEGLNQFLELQAYNLLLNGATTPADWVFTRGYVRGHPGNTGVHLLMDIHQLIGQTAMRTAYQRILPMRPPFGTRLSADARQVFVDVAPAAVRTEVAALAAKLEF